MFIVFVNQYAGWVKRQTLETVQDTIQRIVGDQGRVIVTQHPDDVYLALGDFELNDITALVPVGGDGTLSNVLSAACKRWGVEKLPTFLPLLAGTMNMIALEARGRREDPLQTLVRVIEASRNKQRLDFVSRGIILSDCGRAGFVAGMGIATRFLAHYNAAGAGFWQAFRSIVHYSRSVLGDGRSAKVLFEPTNVVVQIDDQPLSAAQSINVLMGLTINTLPLGFHIGITSAHNGMTLLFGKANALPLIAGLPLLHRGFLPKSMGVKRITARKITMSFATPQSWQMDGDILPSVSQLTWEVGGEVRLLV